MYTISCRFLETILHMNNMKQYKIYCVQYMHTLMCIQCINTYWEQCTKIRDRETIAGTKQGKTACKTLRQCISCIIENILQSVDYSTIVFKMLHEPLSVSPCLPLLFNIQQGVNNLHCTCSSVSDCFLLGCSLSCR